MSNPSIIADKTPWYQWGTGLTVTVSGGAMTECHFANRKQGTAYVQAVINGVARVPDELLQVAAPIKAYGYVSDGAGGQTYVEQSFEVIARNIPADYTCTKTAQKTIRDAEAARDQAVQAAKDAKASALAADDSAIEASKSAQSAGDSASAVATSASNAAKSAGEAAKSASEAKAAASKTVEDASELLKTYTDNAKTSADNAATSASDAADAASAASDSASAAEQSATDASSAKAEAEKAKDAAATSESNAESSATAAEKSASDAAASVGAINVIAPKTVPNSATVQSDKPENLAIGSGAKSEANLTVAIGPYAVATHNGSVALGLGSEDSKDYELSVGTPANASSGEMTREITHVSTPSANTSASTKKYTDDNDAKTLTEAKKYTDDNTTNALIGKVSGKLLHVEDAWPSPLLNVTIDGAYKQDGTPSPENPVPIVVIENPVLKVTGRNLQPYPFAFHHEKVVTINGVTFTDNGDGSITASGTAEETALYNLDLTTDAKFLRDVKVTASMSKDLNFSVECFGADGSIKPVSGNVNAPASFPSDAQTLRNYIYLASGKTVNTTVYPQFEYGDKATSYRPYVSKTLPITLPAEHPYLAALPDGTHDEIVIDKDGNVRLVARVVRSDMPNVMSIGPENNQLGKDGTVNRWIAFGPITGARVANGGTGLCTHFVNAGNTKNRDTVRFGASNDFLYLYTSNEDIIGDGTASSVAAWFAEHQTSIVYPLATPVTYPLSKLAIPSLPETISNVWTSAELTTSTSMTYKQDVNAVIAGLNAQIAALKGTANEPPEITDPTIE